MNARPLAAAAALIAAAFAASPALAGCCLADPSALDLEPATTPLRVARVPPTGELRLSWEDDGHDSRIWQGDLAALWATSRLDDEVVAQGPGAEALVPEPSGDAYFLVSAVCQDLWCTRGRDSFGTDRGTPGCGILERGDINPTTAQCLAPDRGVVRDGPDYAAFAGCFTPGWEPPRPGADQALVWMTDFSPAACGTCLEFTCAVRAGDDLIVEPHGAPWGECDAIHHGGAWALVTDAPRILFLEQMPPLPDYSPCN